MMRSALLSLLAAASLAACGGGGGGDSGSTSSTSSTSSSSATTSSVVTSANATDVAATAYTASTSVASGATSSLTLVGATSVDAGSTGDAGNGLVDVTLQQINKVLEQKSASSNNFGSNNYSANSTTSQSVNCSTSGSISYTVVRAVDGTVSNDDSLTITANNCIQGSTQLSGSFRAKFANLAGTPSTTGAWSATLQLTYTAFRIVTSAGSLTYQGDISLAVNQASSTNVSYTISGSSFGFVLVYQGKTVSQTLKAFSFAGSNVSGVYTNSADFALSGTSPALGTIAYTVKTTLPFKRTGTYPYQGSLTVTGSNGSSLKLSAIDSTYAKIEIDKDGDGVYEESSTTTWVALANR